MSEDTILSWAGVVAIVFIGAIFLGGVFRFAISDGRADYCYIAAGHGETVNLWAHVPWRADRFVNYYPNVEGAVAAAHAVACPLTK